MSAALRALLVAAVVVAGVFILSQEDIDAAPPASNAYSAQVTCQNGVVSPVSCGSDGQSTIAVQAKGNTSNKVYLGFAGLNASNYTTAGFEYCNGCLAGAVYSADVSPNAALKCVGGGATPDAGIVIAVQCLKP